MEERGAEPVSSSPGARLAVARTEAGLSVTQAAERLHLDARTLEALESGRFQGLGANVFVRGHLRRYAELVGVPEAEIMASYDAWSGRLAARPDLRDVITAAPGRSTTRRFELRPRVALIGAIVLVPLALVWWAVRMPAEGRHAAKAAAAVVVPAVVAVPAAAAAPAVAVPAAVAAPAAVAGTTVHLALALNHDSWIEVYDAGGAALYHGLARSESQHRVAGSAPLRLFLGNPMAVSLELNGRPVELKGTTAASRPRHFSLDSVGHVIDIDGHLKAD